MDKYDLAKAIVPRLKEEEGFRPSVYIPTKGDVPTIYYGHTGKHAKHGVTGDKAEGERVLLEDINAKIPSFKKLIPNIDNYPPEVQEALFSEHYRGMVGKSPKFLEHFNNNRYIEAANEYIDADDYRNPTRRGVQKRMDRVKDSILKYQLQNLPKTHPSFRPVVDAKPGQLGMVTGKRSYREI